MLFRWCGPGTRLQERINQQGVNPLDDACKKHDIAYSQFKDVENRNIADRELAEEAWKRVKAKDSSFGEKTAAWFVTNIMKAKSKIGMGAKKRKTRRRKIGRKNKKMSFLSLLAKTKKEFNKEKIKNLPNALRIAKRIFKKSRNVKKPRVIPIAGGFLPLLPLFAAISAIGSISAAGAQVAKVVKEAAAAKDQLAEARRHNEKMEAISIGKGLSIKKYKSGLGLFLKPYKSGGKN